MDHETPDRLASALSRFIPVWGSAYLDPAAGRGVLVEAAVARIRNPSCKIVCVDTNLNSLASIKKQFTRRLNRGVEIRHGDFLSPEMQGQLRSEYGGFDCVFMNPPFLGRREHSRALHRHAWHELIQDKRCVSPEVAFLLYSIELVRFGGRIVTILPSSVIAGGGLRWLRELLFVHGTITRVHELPRRIFPGVEAVTYLTVFDKGIPGRTTTLCNHNLWRPEKVTVTKGQIGGDLRLDYRYHDSRQRYNHLQSSWPQLGWKRLYTLATVERGKLSSIECNKTIIHTTMYKAGAWRAPSEYWTPHLCDKSPTSRSGDILLTRVGRHSALSFGMFASQRPHRISDCVFRIRPLSVSTVRSILFGLRCVYACTDGQSLLERGSGACYLSKEAILALEVPVKLASIFRSMYLRYCYALKRGNIDVMHEIEIKIRNSLGYAHATSVSAV